MMEGSSALPGKVPTEPKRLRPLVNGDWREYKGLMPISEALAAGKALVEVSKLVTNLINTPDTDAQHVRAKLQEMLIHLVNAQTGLSEAQQEIMELRAKLDDRNAAKALEEDMDYQIDGGFYVRKSEAAKGMIPYCPLCWGSDGKAVPLKPSTAVSGSYNCFLHKTEYRTARGVENTKQFYQSLDRPARGDW
jgi:hypothetical protein